MTGRWLFGAVGVLIALLYFAPYSWDKYSQGPNRLQLVRTHPIKPNKFMLLHWGYDADREMEGWCIIAADHTGKVARRLVFNPDAEFLRYRDEWLKD